MIAALPKEGDRAVWATATSAGLRAGELAALRWENVDLAKGVIRITRSWDPKARQMIEPKSRAAYRTVPIAGMLRDHLLAWKLRSEREEGLVFGPDGRRSFDHGALWQRAANAWAAANEEEVEKAKKESASRTCSCPSRCTSAGTPTPAS